jgi:hypothetical protein
VSPLSYNIQEVKQFTHWICYNSQVQCVIFIGAGAVPS